MKTIYLDHNATTPLHPEVLEVMLPYLGEDYGNASSIHQLGLQARKAVEDAREKVAVFLGAGNEEIIFTSGGTESDNLAIKGVMWANESKGKHIITSAIEHHAVLNTCKYLEKKGYKVTYIPVDRNGVVSPDDVKKAITGETALISIMFANNETGSIQSIAEIGRIAKEKGVLFHTDAVQAAGKVPLNVRELKVDLLSISGHKLYGPKGIGALFIKKGTKMQQLFHGGHHEKNRRAGTENVPAIAGFGKAVELAGFHMDTENTRLKFLRDKLHENIKNKIDRVYLNGHIENRLSNTLNLSFEYIEGEGIILNLDLKGIAVASGSACTSGSLEPSHVLSAMGVDAALSQGSIRFSLGMSNTQEDMEYTANVLVETVAKLRSMSPLYKK